MGQFPDHLGLKDISKYSAVLAMDTTNYQRHRLPRPEDPTGTVTFIKYREKCYAVTAGHVIEIFKDKVEKGAPLRFMCPVGKMVRIRGPFMHLPSDFSGYTPDIAITPIDEACVYAMGKDPYDVTGESARWPLTHAIATGFPTALKEDIVSESGGYWLSMGFVRAIAESVGNGGHQTAQFYSELDNLPSVSRLSGVSGGPAFWTDGDAYGVVGIVTDAMEAEDGEITGGLAKVQFMVHRVDDEIWKEWLSDVDRFWPSERQKQDESEAAYFKALSSLNQQDLQRFLLQNSKGTAYYEWVKKLGPRDRPPRSKNARHLPEFEWW